MTNSSSSDSTDGRSGGATHRAATHRADLPTRRCRSPLERALGGLGALILVGVVVSGTWAAIQSPRWNWDVVGYLGCAFEFCEGSQANSVEEWRVIQDRTYQAIAQDLTETTTHDLRAGNSYRSVVSSDPNSFGQQLPFYRIRPVYSGTVALLHGSGVSAVWSTVIVAIGASLLLALVVLFGFLRHFPLAVASFGTVLVLGASSLMDTARSSSPDTMAALLVTIGAALSCRRTRIASALGLGFLVISIGARTDTIVFVMPLLAALALTEPEGRRRWSHGVAAGLSLLILVWMQSNAGWYGWQTLFLHTFSSPIPYPEGSSATVSSADYFQQLFAGFGSRGRDRALGASAVALVLAVWTRRTSPRSSALAAAVFVSILAHYLLFPVWWKRFFVGQYAIIAGLAVVHVAKTLGLERRPRQRIDDTAPNDTAPNNTTPNDIEGSPCASH